MCPVRKLVSDYSKRKYLVLCCPNTVTGRNSPVFIAKCFPLVGPAEKENLQVFGLQVFNLKIL
jgi:hypothetical protein